MKTLFKSFFFVSIFLLQNINAQESFVHSESGVSVTLPAGWFYESEENNMLAYTEDKSVAISFTILNSKNLNEALDEVDKMLEKEYASIELGEAEELEINGLSTIWLDGKADDLEMAYLIVDSPYENIIMFVSAWGTVESVEKYKNDINLIFENIGPASE